MANETTAEKLYALARDSAKRTKFARFLDLIDAIETALGAGVSRESVRLALSGDGLELSMPTFKTFLQRARARRRMSVTTTTEAPPARSADSELPAAQPVQTGQRRQSKTTTERNHQVTKPVSHNPADLRGLRDADPGLEELSKFSKGRIKK
jgi:hypothetical protein